jgi:hypothetical protein
MAKNADQIRVAANGSLNVAALGSTLPDGLDALAGAFFDLGYIDEDGVTVTKGRTVEEIRSWQSGAAVRKFVTEETFMIAGNLQEWSQQTIVTAFGGGEWTEPEVGVFRYDPPDPEDGLPEQAVVLDWQDGPAEYRLVVPKMSVEEDLETSLQRNAESKLPTTLSGVADDNGKITWYLLTNDENLEIGS